MAAPSKKHMGDNDSKKYNKNSSPASGKDGKSHVSGEENMEDEEDIGELMNTKINVEFEARNAEHFDFHGIRKLLHQLFLKANVDLSEFSNEIIAQNHVGSVIKQVELSEEEADSDDDGDSGGEGDVFGVITVISLTDDTTLKCVQQLKSMLVERCAKASGQLSARLGAALDNAGQHVGLIVNERFINIPPQISLPSFNALWKEVERAAKQKDKYSFASYVMIAKTYLDASDKQSQRTFVNAEEEIFFENADLTFDYSVRAERDTGISDQWDGDDIVLEPIRTVMLISANKLPAIMQRMTQLLSQ